MKSTNFLKYSVALIVIFVLFGSICFLPYSVGAAETMKSVLGKAGKGLTGSTTVSSDTLPTLIGGYIKIFLTILGIILVIIIVYAGFLWMTAGGDKEQVTKAKDWMKNAVIGMVILLSAYAITSFVVTKLVSVSDSKPAAPSASSSSSGSNYVSDEELEEALEDD